MRLELSKTNIKPIQHSLLDEYDLALMELHKEILDQKRTAKIVELQEKVLIVRNRIAKKLVDASWLAVPEDQRR